jgi:APA family basic amino acid/polyamine antiporter/L-type amino acid transporter 9
VLFLLGNALMDPAQRVPTLGVFGVILLGVPVFYSTVGRNAK